MLVRSLRKRCAQSGNFGGVVRPKCAWQCAHRRHCYPEAPLQSHPTFQVSQNRLPSLLTFSSQISEDFWVFLSFPSDRSIFSTFVGGTLRSFLLCTLHLQCFRAQEVMLQPAAYRTSHASAWRIACSCRAFALRPCVSQIPHAPAPTLLGVLKKAQAVFSQGTSELLRNLGFLERTLLTLGCIPRGSCNNTLFRRVLRRFSNSKSFLEGFLKGACRGFEKRQGSQKGS